MTVNAQQISKVLTLLMLMAGCVSFATAADDAQPKADTAKENPAIRLESTFVGDKEQPAISYFIPWKGSEAPEKLQWNLEPKHDQTLQVVDRDVLINSMNVYNELDMEMTNAAK